MIIKKNSAIKYMRIICVVTLIIYVAVVLMSTVINRSQSIFAEYNLKLFWSYISVYNGDTSLGHEIVMNIVMFVPMGFLLTAIIGKSNKRFIRLVTVILAALIMSMIIEFGQLIRHTGLFEFDDMIDNTIGAILGIGCFIAFEKLLNYLFDEPKKHLVVYFLICVCIISAVIYEYHAYNIEEFDDIATEYVFRVEKVEADDGLELTGYCFLVDQEQGTGSFDLYVKSLSDNSFHKLNLTTGIQRNDVNKYYKGEYTYTNSGYMAQLPQNDFNSDDPYEIMIKWQGIDLKSTGSYLNKDELVYVNPQLFKKPEAKGKYLREIVDNGIPLIFSKEYACYLYQYKGTFYWLMDKNSKALDDNLETPYHIWTTQLERIPQKMLDLGATRDCRGWTFISGEVTNNMEDEDYRVSTEPIPNEYAIVSVAAGLYRW